MLFRKIFLLLFILSNRSVVYSQNDTIGRLMVELQESTVVHTNKPYYYPTERVWYKVYLIYANYNYRDSLSKVLNVDLISPEKKIVWQKKLKIDDGVSSGDFALSDSLKAGVYFLRTYTSWMRNYGQQLISYTPMYVLNQQEAPIETHKNIRLCSLISSASSRNDSSILTLRINIPNLKYYSLSVIDTSRVKWVEPIPYSNKLKPDYPIDTKWELKYALERTLQLEGYVKGKIGKNANLLLRNSSGEFYMVGTNEKGEFIMPLDSVNNEEIFTVSLSDKPNRAIELAVKNGDVPTVHLPIIPFPATREYVESMLEKDLISTDGIQLKEVAVKAKKSQQPKLYGRTDAVVMGDDIINAQVSNPILALQGKIPGVQIMTLNNRIVMDVRGSQKSTFNTKIQDPLILLDGVPFGIESLNDLSAISVTNIDRIEVVKGVRALYGTRGANGIVAIYTKNSVITTNQSGAVPTVFTISVKGFEKPSTFIPQRNTLNWVSNGDYHGQKPCVIKLHQPRAAYRVELMGVLDDGSLVKCINYVNNHP